MITTNAAYLKNDITYKQKNEFKYPICLILKEEKLILTHYKIYYLAILWEYTSQVMSKFKYLVMYFPYVQISCLIFLVQINGWNYSPGTYNFVRTIKILNNWDSNYRTNFQWKKCGLLKGKKNLFELTEFSNHRAFILSEFDTNSSQIHKKKFTHTFTLLK